MASEAVYATAAEIRTSIGQNSETADTHLLRIATAVSRLIDGFCGRQTDGFVALATAAAREYAGDGQRYLWIDECIAISSVGIKNSVTQAAYTTLEATEWRGFRGDPKTPSSLNFNGLPYHGLMLTANARQYFFLNGAFLAPLGFPLSPDVPRARESIYEPTVTVTAKWGYSAAVPPTIKEACIMQSARVYKREQGAMADALLTGDFGQMQYLSELDKDVKVMLTKSGLMRPTIGGR